jgi:ferredoxin
MREPAPAETGARELGAARRRLGWLLALLPVLVAAGAWAGSKLSPAAAQLHPGVALAERYIRQQTAPVQYGLMTPEALSLQRAAGDPAAILKAASDLRRRFDLACWLFGGWIGLVIGLKLVSLSVLASRTDYEPDRGACLGCARCFTACPNERVRLGWMPAAEKPAPL